MEKREDMRTVAKMMRMTPQESLDNLQIPGVPALINELNQLVQDGNRIVSCSRSNVEVAVYPLRCSFNITYVSPSFNIESKGISCSFESPKTSNI